MGIGRLILVAAAGLAIIPAAAASQQRADYQKDKAALSALISAELAEHQQNPRRALAEWQRLSVLIPDLPDVDSRILDQAIAAGDMASAAVQAEKMWAAGDKSLDARIILIGNAIRRSNWKAAENFVSDGLSGPAKREWERMFGPILRGWIAVGRKDRGGIAQAMTAENDRIHPALAGHKALMLLALGDKNSAAEVAAALQPSDRTSQLIAVHLAHEFQSTSMLAEAEDLRGRIRFLDQNSNDPAMLLPPRRIRNSAQGVSQWFGAMAESFNRLNNNAPTPAMPLARAALYMDRDNLGARLLLVEELVSLNRLEDAKILLEQSRNLPPIARLHRAEILMEMGENQAAIAEASGAVAAEDTPISLRIMQAELIRKSEDEAATKTVFDRLLADLARSGEDPALQALLLISLADMRLKSEDWSAVSPLIDRAVTLAPRNSTVLNFAGYSALERRIDLAQSLDLIKRAHLNQPDNPSITDSLGWAYHVLGRHEEAVLLLEEAWRGEPTNAVIGEHLGDAYWFVGQRVAARGLWNAASTIAEADDEAMRSRLESKMKIGLNDDNAAP